MSLFYPDMLKNKITDITPDDLKKLGVRGLLLDVDNTLTTHGSQVLDPAISEWLDNMKALGFMPTIVSNGVSRRVAPFAKKLGLRYISFACKPLPIGFIRGARRLGMKRRECVAIGDQSFTDIIGANLARVRSIQLLPILPEHQITLRFKRRFEGHILKRYRKSKNK
ncbi:MAG: YqeG family HAD IIIA-type phosphatase [Oscillospiraceae bacterium]|mgnify:CR=1 FL=1|nr:YqeG family HAD IIIA-type phosphatase [Oscillospiraceae bacterium]MDD3833369.1 YqeG family HAD IIIA-type phosphatase [Oscillospiraceae bacterium]MDD4545802.1 YqeG family HAD IIIA-type phosphatase [Oscillospiraceae bacterium]